MSIDALIQVGLACVGVTALLLVSFKRRAGFIVGLCGQPLWITFAVRSRAWGVLALTCCYTVTWGLGVWNHYLRVAEREEQADAK